MQIRKMVMAQMARSNAIKGTITPESAGTIDINFGKTLSKYLFLVEMTETSKAALLATGLNEVKAYEAIGMYPNPGIGSYDPTACYFTYRVNPSTGVCTSSNYNTTASYADKLTFNTCALSTNYSNYLYVGCTYNYTIVPID